MSSRKSIKQSIAQSLILFLSLCLIVISDSHAQENTFTLMGKNIDFRMVSGILISTGA